MRPINAYRFLCRAAFQPQLTEDQLTEDPLIEDPLIEDEATSA